jgi:POT family proton-dependent oligopeptide transporter
LFWSAYSLAPMALTVFAEANVNRHFLGFLMPTEWFQNVNTIVIAVGGAILPSILIIIRKRFIFGSVANIYNSYIFTQISML